MSMTQWRCQACGFTVWRLDSRIEQNRKRIEFQHWDPVEMRICGLPIIRMEGEENRGPSSLILINEDVPPSKSKVKKEYRRPRGRAPWLPQRKDRPSRRKVNQ